MRFLSPVACGEALLPAAQQQVLLREVRLRLLLDSTRLESGLTLPLFSVLTLSLPLETNFRVVPIPVECSHAKWVHNPLQFSSAHSSRTVSSEPLSTRRRLLCALQPLQKRTRNSPPFPFLIEFRFLTRRCAVLCVQQLGRQSPAQHRAVREAGALVPRPHPVREGHPLQERDLLLGCMPLQFCLAVYQPSTMPTRVRRVLIYFSRVLQSFSGSRFSVLSSLLTLAKSGVAPTAPHPNVH